MAIKYKRRTKLSVQLRLLDYAIESDFYKTEIGGLATRMREAIRLGESFDDDGYWDGVIEFIENMLGVQFVLCQLQISSITEAVLRIDEQRVLGALRLNISANKRATALREFGPRFNKDFSKIEVLWQLGNYFKHRDQWNAVTWDRAHPRTELVIRAAGLKPGRSNNLRQIAKKLGNKSFGEPKKFSEIVRAWSTQIRTIIDAASVASGP